jgi:hypothetical protein
MAFRLPSWHLQELPCHRQHLQALAGICRLEPLRPLPLPPTWKLIWCISWNSDTTVLRALRGSQDHGSPAAGRAGQG